MNWYLNSTKNLANSFIFILPLLVIYEIGIALHGANIKNTADVVIERFFGLLGKNGSLIFNLLVIILLFISLFYIEKNTFFNPLTVITVFILMFIESIAYAIFIGVGISSLVYKILFPYVLAIIGIEKSMYIILSAGAGVYEEILFRFILISFLCIIFITLLKMNKYIGKTISVIIGSLIFAILHYIGNFSDNFTYTNFTFRLLSGIILSVIFIMRGLGVAVYTHAIYDLITVIKPFKI